MRLLTAYDDDELRTLPIEIWMVKRNVTLKYLQQRLRNGYTDDEAVNLPKGGRAKSSMRGRHIDIKNADLIFTSKKDSMWLRFATGGFKRRGMI